MMEQESLFNRSAKYWIAVAAEDHVAEAVQGGFAQFCHGRGWPARRVARGDGLIYYSSRKRYGEDDPSRTFTAIGQIDDEVPFQVTVSATFRPFRRRVRYFPGHKVPLAKILPHLEFTKIRAWGMRLRVGFIEISASDFLVLREALLGKGADPMLNL